jgi:hypothetical protein
VVSSLGIYVLNLYKKKGYDAREHWKFSVL